MILRLALALMAIVSLALPAAAQDREVPYWATLRSSEINMRVGPSADYKIAWVYRRKGLPVKVVRVLDGWRLIEDPDGTQGWVASRLLSPERGAIVTGDSPTAIRDDHEAGADLKWRAEPGVIGVLGACEDGWCQFSVGEHKGWVRQNRLWGAGAP